MFQLLKIFNHNSDNIEKLEMENKILKDKLAERQEIINKTNAYWKKKVAGGKRKMNILKNS